MLFLVSYFYRRIHFKLKSKKFDLYLNQLRMKPIHFNWNSDRENATDLNWSTFQNVYVCVFSSVACFRTIQYVCSMRRLVRNSITSISFVIFLFSSVACQCTTIQYVCWCCQCFFLSHQFSLLMFGFVFLFVYIHRNASCCVQFTEKITKRIRTKRIKKKKINSITIWMV